MREWSRPDLGRNTHLAYAFQWYALSLAIFDLLPGDPCQTTPRRKAVRPCGWLRAVCIAPFVASFAAYYFYQPEGRVNYGELMADKPLPRCSADAG